MEGKCKHADCRCTGGEVRRDGYCSDNCRAQHDAAGRIEGGCTCGHAQCR